MDKSKKNERVQEAIHILETWTPAQREECLARLRKIASSHEKRKTLPSPGPEVFPLSKL